MLLPAEHTNTCRRTLDWDSNPGVLIGVPFIDYYMVAELYRREKGMVMPFVVIEL